MARKLRAPRASNDATPPAAKAKGAAPSSNVSDATIIEFTNKAIKAHSEFEEKRGEAKKAQASYRAVLKDAKKAGVDQDSIVWLINARKREPEDIDRETRNRNRIAKLMALPIGTQLGLLDDGSTVATAVDNEKQAAPVADVAGQAYSDGYEAGRVAKPHSDCPHAEETPLHTRWMDGWAKAQSDIVLGNAAA
jgi:ribosome modulation factor